jgi:glutamyl-tRNA synthetase
MVRTRFAPSPTGYLHIGGVRTALFNWLFARQHEGQFILRIDDTDRERNIAEAVQPILDGFRWLGIDWDEGPEVGGPHGPYYQSERAGLHRDAAQRLLDSGFAYKDYATTEEVQAERRAAERDKRPFVYSRKWMAERDEQSGQFEAQGRSAVVRLKMPREGKCRFNDLVRGALEFDWAAEQDHVIQRADGSCLYHLASVVDDHELQITHVIRAVEHLSNTPRQIFIAQALGYSLPQYAHLPYVAEPGSSNKLSKRKLDKYLQQRDFKRLCDQGEKIAAAIGLQVSRDTFNPVIVDFYRSVGYLPDALVNYLLLLGWSLDDKTEDFTRDEMVRSFSLGRVNRAPASFDPQKLLAIQDRYLRAVPVEQKVGMVTPYLQKAGLISDPPPDELNDTLTQILQAAGDRIKVAGDILDYADFFTPDDQLPYDRKAFEKRLKKPPRAAELLRQFHDELARVERFDATALEQLLHEFVDAHGIKIADVIHALRVAVTGKPVGFGLFETLAVLGRQSSLARIERALAILDGGNDGSN